MPHDHVLSGSGNYPFTEAGDGYLDIVSFISSIMCRVIVEKPVSELPS